MREAHVKTDLRYHFVFCTKYRRRIFTTPILRESCRETIRQICEEHDYRIIRGIVAHDHIHLLLLTHSTDSPSTVMNTIKGASSHELRKLYPELMSEKALWARGFYCATVGKSNESAIQEYLRDHEGRD